MYIHPKGSITMGPHARKASKGIIMLHGRGSSAEDIIALSKHLQLEDTTIIAPQAMNNSWYPNSFMAPANSNQPDLDASLNIIQEYVEDITGQGVPVEQLFFLGFSQGACLALEYTARNAQRYGGVIAFTGGLIGQELNLTNYDGDFLKTPVLITTGDPDMHVPLSRVEESVRILENMQADVTLKVYKQRPHTIQMQEIELARQLVLKNEY